MEELKQKIEKMDAIHQIHIGSILRQNPQIKLNANKSGILVNISTLPSDIIEEIQTYVNYVIDQEKILNSVETTAQQLLFEQEQQITNNITV